MSSDHWLPMTSFSNIKLKASAACQEHISEHHSIDSVSFFLSEVAGVNQVVSEWLIHIICQFFYYIRIRDCILSGSSELAK